MTISMTGNYSVIEPCALGPLMKVSYIMRGFFSKEIGCKMDQSMGAGKEANMRQSRREYLIVMEISEL